MNQIGQLYPPEPYDYTREWAFLVDFITDRDIAGALLPDAIRPDPDGRAWIRATKHKTSSFGPYIGAYIGLYGEYDGRPVRYIVSGLKTDFMGTIAAREIWGLPYSLGRVDAGWSGSMFTCTLSGYAGEELAQIMLHTTSRQTAPSPGMAACYVAPLRDHCGNVMRMQLLSAENSASAGETDPWNARASVRLPQASPMNDWSQIPVEEVVHAEYRTGGRSSLGMATVLAEW